MHSSNDNIIVACYIQ